ncbi:hypothetical protein BpHYR1_029051 [Brachionus plicatilis]|uniref:Uncharacterized protein n=1 Tax=Brachionus plicatilis TaxID=10195 RepID=A0A3M7QJ94_BRAPC|nr:hypothetical protein BpHYR1_029051 [Brachionus plicatilis]
MCLSDWMRSWDKPLRPIRCSNCTSDWSRMFDTAPFVDSHFGSSPPAQTPHLADTVRPRTDHRRPHSHCSPRSDYRRTALAETERCPSQDT